MKRRHRANPPQPIAPPFRPPQPIAPPFRPPAEPAAPVDPNWRDPSIFGEIDRELAENEAQAKQRLDRARAAVRRFESEDA